MKKEPKKPGRPVKPDDKKRVKNNYTLSIEARNMLETLSENTGESMSAILERCIRGLAGKEDEGKSSSSRVA